MVKVNHDIRDNGRKDSLRLAQIGKIYIFDHAIPRGHGKNNDKGSPKTVLSMEEVKYAKKQMINGKSKINI